MEQSRGEKSYGFAKRNVIKTFSVYLPLSCLSPIFWLILCTWPLKHLLLPVLSNWLHSKEGQRCIFLARTHIGHWLTCGLAALESDAHSLFRQLWPTDVWCGICVASFLFLGRDCGYDKLHNWCVWDCNDWVLYLSEASLLSKISIVLSTGSGLW